jgi:hypothetical protein
MPQFDRRGGYCLIFQAADIARRVREYPDDWYDRPADELHRLSLRYLIRGEQP